MWLRKDEPSPEYSENVIKGIVETADPVETELKEDIKEPVGNVDEETKQSLRTLILGWQEKVAENPVDSTEDKKEQ